MRGGMNMTRDEEIDYAKKRGIPVEATKKSPYSVDENLWGRSIEAGVLEDPWGAPPRDVFQWTVDPDEAPAKAREVEIEFREGIPTKVDGDALGGVALIEKLNALGGKHGVGRIDQIENRLVGIKSREIYEAPAAVILHLAHRALEDMVLSKESLRFKAQVGREYADLVYNGLWFSAHHQDLAAYVRSTQRFVTGEIRVRLHRGTATVVGRRSPHSLYSTSLATYGKGDAFDHKASEGFIRVFGLPLRTQARTQALWGEGSEAMLDVPKKIAGRLEGKKKQDQMRTSGEAGSKPLWSGRFEGTLDPRIRAFTASLELDKRIALHDVRGSIAHARMLGRQGILAPDESAKIVAELEKIAAEIKDGSFVWPADAEDVHSAVEHVLTERLGRGRRQAAHRAQPERSGRARPAPARRRAARRP